MSKLPRNIEAELAKLGVTDLSRVSVGGQPIQEALTAGRTRSVDDKYRSKTERTYAGILELDQADGLIRRWLYEPLRFKLAESEYGAGAWFCPDFAVWLPDGTMELREIKGGFVREAARVRFLVAKRLYPEFSWKMIQHTKLGWQVIL